MAAVSAPGRPQALAPPTPLPRNSVSAFLSRRLSQLSRSRIPRTLALRCSSTSPSSPNSSPPGLSLGSASPRLRRKSGRRSSSSGHRAGVVAGAASVSSFFPLEGDASDSNWLLTGYSGSNKLTGRSLVSTDSGDRTTVHSCKLADGPAPNSSLLPKTRRRSSTSKRGNKRTTCKAAVTCISSEEAVLASPSTPSGFDLIPHYVPVEDRGQLRGVQDLLEQVWLLPCPSLDDFQEISGSDDGAESVGEEALGNEVDEQVEKFVAQILSRRRRRGCKDLKVSPTEVALSSVTDLTAGICSTSETTIATQKEKTTNAADPLSPSGRPSLTNQDTEPTLEDSESMGVDPTVLVKFPEPSFGLETRSSTNSRRKSVELGKRVLVRSMRKRRLSLGSRVGVIKGVVKPLEGRRQVPAGIPEASTAGASPEEEAEVEKEMDVDRVLRGYGWKGNSNLEWGVPKNLLDPKEEQEVLVFLEQGQALESVQKRLTKSLGRDPLPSELAEEAQCTVGEVHRTRRIYLAAKNKLVMHNLGLVVTTAKVYLGLGFGVDFASLCQRGVRGLYAAAERFSSKRKCRFSTFASICVRTVITREVAASMHVRAPTYMTYKLMQLQRAERYLETTLGRPPTDEDVAKEIKVGIGQLKVIKKLFTEFPALLHQDVKGMGVQLADIIPDPEIERKEGEGQVVIGDAEMESVRYALDDVIDSLKPREAVVIRQRFGLDGYGERSLRDIGKNLSVSREMVRKYEARALAKLKLPERAALFQTYLDGYE